MTTADGKPIRPWQEIAEEASHEQDPQRLIELTKDLECTLEERDKNIGQRSPQPASSSESDFLP